LDKGDRFVLPFVDRAGFWPLDQDANFVPYFRANLKYYRSQIWFFIYKEADFRIFESYNSRTHGLAHVG